MSAQNQQTQPNVHAVLEAIWRIKMMERIACWHGEKAAEFYLKWSRTNSDADLRDYARHSCISKKMWESLQRK